MCEKSIKVGDQGYNRFTFLLLIAQTANGRFERTHMNQKSPVSEFGATFLSTSSFGSP